MFKSLMTNLRHGQEHHGCTAENAIDRLDFVPLMRVRNVSAINVFAGFIPVQSVSRET